MVSAERAKWTKDNLGSQSVDKAPFSVAEPNIQMGGGGWRRSSRPWRGMPGLKKFFFRPFASQFGLKIRGGPPGPSPRSATGFVTVPEYSSPGTNCEGTLSLLLTSHVNLNSNFRILYGFFLSVYPWPWRRLILLALIILFCLASNKSAYRRIANPAFIFYVFCF